jgi:hypothetical protein
MALYRVSHLQAERREMLTSPREGAATVGIGAICCFFLPEYPYNAKLLTPLERQVAVYRLEKEAGAGEGSEDIGTWQGFKIGLRDIKVSFLIC